MKAPNLIALAAAVLITATSVNVMRGSDQSVPMARINGVPVFDLAPVNVSPNAAQQRLALLSPELAEIDSATLMDAAAPAAQTLIGPQLAMPYYSFASKIGRISKD